MQIAPRRQVLADRYELGPEVGRGAMGTVRRAHDQRLDRDVAVKFLHNDLAADSGARRRFEDEARSAARIGHPNAVTVFDAGEHDGAVYLVMECLPGRSLADELAEGPLDPWRACQIAGDVLAALGAAHALGIVHRDVKPANILLAVDGTAKVADFGIAKATEGLDLTTTGQVIGTPAYLAPERLHGAAATPRSDLYSVGVVLYEALTGSRPFGADTPAAVVHAIAATDPPPIRQLRPEVDKLLAAAVDRAMHKDPARRFQHAADMAQALAAPSRPTAMSADATSTAVVPPTEVQPYLPPTRTDVNQPATVRAGAPSGPRWPSRPVVAAALAALVVLAALVPTLALRDDGDGGPNSPTSSSTATTTPPASDSTLPQPLDDAITELEETVAP